MATPDEIKSPDLQKDTTEISEKSLDPVDVKKIEEACLDPNQADRLEPILNTSLTTALDDCSDPAVVNNIKAVIKETTNTATDDANKMPPIEAPKKTETVAQVFTKEFKGTNTGNTKEAYNEKSTQLIQAKLLIADREYVDLPGVDLIKGALNNPTKENIEALQTFLNTNVDAITPEQKTKVDGKFGPKTDAALTAYLQEFSTFKLDNQTKATNKTTAEKAANDIVIKNKPVEVSKIVVDAPKNVDAPKTKIEAPTIAELQEDKAFTSIPKDLQRKIKRILDLDAKDDKVDNKLADIDKKTEEINKDIVTLQNQNIENGKRMLQIDADIKTMEDNGLGRKDIKSLIDERKELASKITANRDKIDALQNDLADLQDDKDRLTNRDTRIGNRLESRLNNVSRILASEIANRKAVIDAISAGTTKENISKDLANLQKVNTMVSSLYPEVDKTEPVTINSMPPSKVENTTTTTPTAVEKAPAVEELTPVEKVEQINNARPIGMEITLNFGDTLYDGKRKLAEPVATEDPNGAMLVMTKDDGLSISIDTKTEGLTTDKMVIFHDYDDGKGIQEVTIHNHGSYADMSPDGKKPVTPDNNIVDTIPAGTNKQSNNLS